MMYCYFKHRFSFHVLSPRILINDCKKYDTEQYHIEIKHDNINTSLEYILQDKKYV